MGAAELVGVALDLARDVHGGGVHAAALDLERVVDDVARLVEERVDVGEVLDVAADVRGAVHAVDVVVARDHADDGERAQEEHGELALEHVRNAARERHVGLLGRLHVLFKGGEALVDAAVDGVHVLREDVGALRAHEGLALARAEAADVAHQVEELVPVVAPLHRVERGHKKLHARQKIADAVELVLEQVVELVLLVGRVDHHPELRDVREAAHAEVLDRHRITERLAAVGERDDLQVVGGGVRMRHEARAELLDDHRREVEGEDVLREAVARHDVERAAAGKEALEGLELLGFGGKLPVVGLVQLEGSLNEEVGRGHAVLKRREREHRWTANAVLGLAHLGGGSGRLGRGRGLDGAGGHLVDVPAGARGRAAAHGLPGCTAAEACGASRDQKPGEDFAVHRIAAREHPTSVG